MKITPSAIRALAILAPLAFLAACSSESKQTPKHDSGGGHGPAAHVPVTLDGNIEEWPADAALLADDQYIYFRVSVEDGQWTLQSGPETLAMRLDVDHSKATGFVGPFPSDQLGADLEIQFSPIGADGRRTNGVAVYAFDAAGGRTPIPNEEADVSFLPTFASAWYEGRISRRLVLPFNGGASMPAAGGPMVGQALLIGDEGQIEGWSDLTTTSAPPAVSPAVLSAAPPLDIPASPVGAIRIVSWNVLKNGPVSKPEPFARVIQTLKPDVILVQEWDDGDAAALASWFTAMAPLSDPSSSQWHAVKGHAGVAIISRFPLTPMNLGTLETSDADGKPSKIRFVTATANSPAGEFALGSTHLKCCGHKDSPEDRLRVAQARAINEAWSSVTPLPPIVRVICGDMNLVGSRPPLDILRASLDADGSDLSVAEPFVLGDRSQYTWSDYKTTFTPGRLDYILYSDSTAQVYQSFVLDTSRLNDETLARAGLERADTDASDHKPVVVDLMPIAK